WVFNPADNSWVKAAPTGDNILPREGHSASVVQGSQMWVFGGISYGHVPFNDLWLYDSCNEIVDTKSNESLIDLLFLYLLLSLLLVHSAESVDSAKCQGNVATASLVAQRLHLQRFERA